MFLSDVHHNFGTQSNSFNSESSSRIGQIYCVANRDKVIRIDHTLHVSVTDVATCCVNATRPNKCVKCTKMQNYETTYVSVMVVCMALRTYRSNQIKNELNRWKASHPSKLKYAKLAMCIVQEWDLQIHPLITPDEIPPRHCMQSFAFTSGLIIS